MNRWTALSLVIAVAGCTGCDRDESLPEPRLVCSDSLYRTFEHEVPTGDGRGHGPDVGSDEWKSVIEFRLGIRGDPDVPPRDTDAWCRHIDATIRSGAAPAATARGADPTTQTAGSA